MRSRSPALWTFIFAMAVVLAWAFYTQHAWEDYYITYRASKNLATGHGLTFTAGERIHSFTSPLGVLLPAAASLLTGNSSDVAALWIFRIMGAAALAGAVVVLQLAFRRLAPTGAVAGLLVALVLSDAKTLDFSINGMETPFLLLFLAWTWWAMVRTPKRQWLHLGLSWAALMWTRPDAFISIGSLAVGVLLFRPVASLWRERLAQLRTFFGAGVLTIALYLPWLLWAWWYYGTPVPHTITAKGLFLPHVSIGFLFEQLKAFPGKVIADHSIMAGTFIPAYGFHTGWPVAVLTLSFWLALLAVILWIVPAVRWEARVASFAAAVGQFYLYSFVGFATPWYLPPVALLAFIALILAWGQLWSKAGDAKIARRAFNWPRKVLATGAILWVLGATILALAVAYQLRWQQKIIEEGQRRKIGLWLREQARSEHDTVFLEPLGYIGFYSNLKMFDYPGLSSPEMVAARRRASSQSYPYCWSELITELQPDWLVLRPGEVKTIRERSPEVIDSFYDAARVFDVREEIKAIGFMPGRHYLEGDAYFETYRRKAELPKGVDLKLINAASLTRRESWGQPAYDSGNNLMAHAPSHLEFPKPAGARWLTGGFGFFEGAYANPKSATDGAIFTINFVGADNVRQVLWERTMSPQAVATDQGRQSFRVELPVASPGHIELLISPGPSANNAYDWTYWSQLRLESPRNR